LHGAGDQKIRKRVDFTLATSGAALLDAYRQAAER